MKGERRQGMAARPGVFNGNGDDVCILSGGLHLLQPLDVAQVRADTSYAR